MHKVRLSHFGLGSLLLTLGVSAASGQIPSSQTTDCSDPTVSDSAQCQSQGQGQGQYGRQQPTSLPSQRTSQQTDSTSRDVYVDSAGYPQTDNTQQQTRRLPRREPPTDFQKLTQQATGEMLPIFGRELFRNAPSTFAPADQIPASPDYILGPGDEVLLRIWGHTNQNLRLTVDRTGSIYVPQLGGVDVAGLRFSDLERHLKQELSRTYKNFDLSVNLGKLRSIQVFVLGEAYSPGSYTVSSLSTVFNALLTSGGPTPEGSLRNVQLRRGTETIATLDLYNFILKGDRSKDIVLQSGDVIFIPFVGPQAAVSGSVRHPAIYELKPDSTVSEVLQNAGGPSSTASQSRVAIERIEDHRERHALSIALDSAGLDTRVHGGDVLHVDPVLIGYKDSVTIRGNLANAGRFPWHEGMKLSDIIPDRESLLTNDYWRERNRLGLPTPLFEPSNQRQGQNNNGPDQSFYGSSQDNSNSQNSQNYQSYPNSQGQYGNQAGSSQSQIPQSNGNYNYPNNNNYPPNQNSADALAAQQYDTPRNGVAARDRMQDAEVESSRGSLADQQVASSRNLAPSGRNTEIKIAVPEIDWTYAVIQRLDHKTLRNSLVPFDLGKLVNDHDSSQDLPLQAGDIVTIVSQNDIHVRQDDQTKYVRLEGEFTNSGVYSVEPGQTLADVVRMAGGVTDKAYLYGSAFTRESARVLQQQRLNEYVASLSMDMERSAATRSASSATAPATIGIPTEENALLEQIRRMRATGRVVLEFKPNSVGNLSIPPIPLEDGDTFRVPSRPVIVSVVGSVYGQNVFLYNQASHVHNYLLLAGKPNRIADRKHSFIIRADGSIYSHDTRGGPWGEKFEAADVYPGDTIVVPEKPIKPSAMKEFIDYSQIFSQFAVGAAAVDVIR